MNYYKLLFYFCRYFFHYSGHGSHQADTDGDEDDKMDESIVPVDARHNKCIIDDDLHKLMIEPLKKGLASVYLFFKLFLENVM